MIDHVYFMFMSHLYPHHEHLKIHDWSMIVFSREATVQSRGEFLILLHKEMCHQMEMIRYIQISMVVTCYRKIYHLMMAVGMQAGVCFGKETNLLAGER